MITPAREKLYQAWFAYADIKLSGTPINVSESVLQKRMRIEQLEADPEQWFAYYFPRYAYAAPAGFHTSSSKRVIENPEWYEVRMWSRELAKSTRTMMDVLYLTLVGHPAAPVADDPLPVTEITAPPPPQVAKRSGPPAEKKTRKPRVKKDAVPKPVEEKTTDTPPLEIKPKRARKKKTTPVPVSPPHSETAARPRKRNVLLISNSLDNAERLLLPYKANLEANNRLINDYGVQQRSGNWEAAEFITHSGISFRAIGAGQSPRGSRNEEIRPDILLFDDLDTDEDCRNTDLIDKRWKWVEEAAMATRSISKATTIIFSGNRIAKDCCVQRASAHADHTSIVNIRDEDGLSTWTEKNTEEYIDRVLSKLSYAAIQKEYYNNPVSQGAVFKSIPYKNARPLSEYSSLVCYTDPSYKESKKNDYKATVLIGKWRDEFHVIKTFLDQTTTAAMVDWHYQIMELIGDHACYYFMEQVFLQDIFFAEFNTASRQRGKVVPIMGDQRQKPDKYVRVEALLQPLVSNGRFYFNEWERENPHMQRLEEQFIHFAPGSRTHDDGPDACEGAVWIINNKENLKNGTGITTIRRRRNPQKTY